MIRIFEVCVPSAVVSVVGYDTKGNALWDGVGPPLPPGVFELRISPSDSALHRLRITLDTSLRTGWNEIDAVELVGPDGRAWVSSAKAGSFYGEGLEQGRNEMLSPVL